MEPASEPQNPARCALVIDDESVVRMVLRRYLARRGWSVLEAETGEVALGVIAAEGEPPDLVLCDLHLPGLSGSELCRQIAGLCPLSRMVLTTGDPHLAAHELARESLDCPILGKPFGLDELDRLIDSLFCAV